jgi:hypothetical protein
LSLISGRLPAEFPLFKQSPRLARKFRIQHFFYLNATLSKWGQQPRSNLDCRTGVTREPLRFGTNEACHVSLPIIDLHFFGATIHRYGVGAGSECLGFIRQSLAVSMHNLNTHCQFAKNGVNFEKLMPLAGPVTQSKVVFGLFQHQRFIHLYRMALLPPQHLQGCRAAT